MNRISCFEIQNTCCVECFKPTEEDHKSLSYLCHAYNILLQGCCSCSEYANISFFVFVAHYVITLLEWTWFTQAVSKPYVDLQLSLLPYDRSAFCVLVKPPWFYLKIISKWKKKISYQSNFKVPLCVWLCCKTHYAVLCQWLLLQHREPAFHCLWP